MAKSKAKQLKQEGVKAPVKGKMAKKKKKK